MRRIERFHFLTRDCENHTHAELAEMACKAGVKWIQLRAKGKEFDEWCGIAQSVLTICRSHEAILIINDSPEVARAVGADGAHLGNDDMNPVAARNLLGPGRIIGGTANRLEDLARLGRQGVDYIGVGPFKLTTSKNKLAPVLGADGLSALVSSAKRLEIPLPLIAVGGIRQSDIETLRMTGVHGVAVSSAIDTADDPQAACKEFLDLMEMDVHETTRDRWAEL